MTEKLKQIRLQIVRPALKGIGKYSPEAENLVLCTGQQESRYDYIKQIGSGPALGYWQMEPETYRDIWENYLAHNETLATDILTLQQGVDVESHPGWLKSNLLLGAAMCRVHYLRKRPPLPQYDDMLGLAKYWKTHYNTHLGKGSTEEFIQNCRAIRLEDAVEL